MDYAEIPYRVLFKLLYGCDNGDIVSQKLISVVAVFTNGASSSSQLKLKSINKSKVDLSLISTCYNATQRYKIDITLSNRMLVGS